MRFLQAPLLITAALLLQCHTILGAPVSSNTTITTTITTIPSPPAHIIPRSPKKKEKWTMSSLVTNNGPEDHKRNHRFLQDGWWDKNIIFASEHDCQDFCIWELFRGFGTGNEGRKEWEALPEGTRSMFDTQCKFLCDELPEVDRHEKWVDGKWVEPGSPEAMKAFKRKGGFVLGGQRD